MKAKWVCGLFLLMLTIACKKESELGNLSSEKNVFDPANRTQFFILDSVKTTQYPSAQLFYHIRFDLIPDPSLISKVIIYRDGELKFNLSLTAPNAFKPTDLWVSRFATYNYTFAFQDKNGGISFFSNSYRVYIP